MDSKLSSDSLSKYQAPSIFQYTEREWPNKQIKKAPIWCSVDLRDGNQALVTPMNLEKKIKLFNYLVSIGFKEIEVGFPSASNVEYEFVRYIIENKLIPKDVTIQVLTQARTHLIQRTLRSIEGTHKAIVHVYNSTSIAQRKYVFNKSKDEIIDIALNGVRDIKQYITNKNNDIVLEYSPESYTGTELDFSIEICNQVLNEWNTSSPVIINLPATVEIFSPNVYADMIEYSSKHLNRRDEVILSVHTHNDRGTGIAATELALLAGADRVEGTLFGNGERTGNLDITTLALNLFSHGINPNLDISDINTMIDTHKKCTLMDVDPRHPYAGDLVFTAFSGSHQDAIKKGFQGYSSKKQPWDIPYLTIDPEDIGRKYEAIIRINTQSGKGGVAYIMEHEFNCIIPKDMQPELSRVIQNEAEKTGDEVSPANIWSIFESDFLNRSDSLKLNKISTQLTEDGNVEINMTILLHETEHQLQSIGNGPIDASKQALQTILSDITVLSYAEHSLSQGSDSNAICYIHVSYENQRCFGVGLDTNITLASVKALFSALNRILGGLT